MSAISPQLLNDAFSTQLNSAEGKEKVAEYGGSFVRDRLREVSFARQILPPQTVTKSDCQRSVNHDTLVKIIDIEPQSRAMTVDFRGKPTARIISGRRAEVGFIMITSEIFQKPEEELLSYEMPITKIIEENSVKDIQEIEDREFLLHTEAAVQALQTEANGGTPTALDSSTVGTTVEFSIRKGELARAAATQDATVRPVQRPDFVNLFKMLDGRRLRAEHLLLTEPDYDDLLQWTVEDNGDRMQSETAIEGYKYSTILGRKFTRTIKTDILRPGNVYVFTRPEYLGRFYVLNNTKFYIDKVANTISFQSWETIGMILANVAAIRKVELYSADANPSTDTQGLLANFIPVSEEGLGAANNRVDAGLKFPQINTY